MEAFFEDFRAAYVDGDGYALSMTISPISSTSNPEKLQAFFGSTNQACVKQEFERHISYHVTPLQLLDEEIDAWVDIYVAFWKAVGEILNAEKSTSKASWIKVHKAWKELTNVVIRGYTNGGIEAWTVPCLYVIAKYTRVFAITADAAAGPRASNTQSFGEDIVNGDEQNEYLEDGARQLNRIFQLCLSDRAPLEESRKWAIYNIINLLFKTYFKLNSISLSKNILRAIKAYRGDMPPLEAFPMSHQVTFKYYVGVIYFLEESYQESEQNLTKAWKMCHKDALHNKELILTYLIPCHLLTTHTLPSPGLLAPYPRLQSLFLPLSRCIKSGNLIGFDAALSAGEEEFIKRRIYLTLERGRDIALRNLFRKVYLAGGVDETKDADGAVTKIRRTRIPVEDFAVAMSVGAKEVMEGDEVECLLANMIYKNLVKGYIARDRGIVVLSKSGAFPGTRI